ncbi:MAG TPA: bifunctional 2-keto-4-hydroxyglutarate aldolase/2-keto-3-deoxy-6-phosphogluconate aldolase, partial [Thermoanaerobaculia bacterium]|nr:bifunctional 2-keto-4-hydroxyglutarate aldolase/2-keto-3-deoxy-6-phosphogluconate aldolase [Thermoanaerobaculia bacterium]
MGRKELLTKICAQQIIGVVREDTTEAAASVADAYAKNGIRIIEITLTTPDAFELISTVSRRYAGDDITVAAGTV